MPVVDRILFDFGILLPPPQKKNLSETNLFTHGTYYES